MFSFWVCSDQLFLKNGDVVSGEILTFSKGLYLFKAEFTGLVNYPYHEAEKIIGHPSSDIADLLGYSEGEFFINNYYH